MSDEQPTLAEIARRLTEATQQLTRLADKLERDYVPRELYNANREADRSDVSDIRTRQDATEKQRAADRRLIFGALVAPVLTALIVLYVVAQLGGAS